MVSLQIPSVDLYNLCASEIRRMDKRCVLTTSVYPIHLEPRLKGFACYPWHGTVPSFVLTKFELLFWRFCLPLCVVLSYDVGWPKSDVTACIRHLKHLTLYCKNLSYHDFRLPIRLCRARKLHHQQKHAADSRCLMEN